MAKGTNIKTIPTLQEHDALTKSANLIIAVAVAHLMMSEARSPSFLAMPGDEKSWMMGDFVVVGEVEQIEMKYRFCNLQDSCRAKRRKVLKSATKAVGLDVQSEDGAGGTLLRDAHSNADSRIQKLDEQVAIARDAIVSVAT